MTDRDNRQTPKSDSSKFTRRSFLQGTVAAAAMVLGSPQVGQGILCEITVKSTPKTDEFEMYNVSEDPMELNNLYNDGIHTSEQNTQAQLLQEQRCAKRLVPSSGNVPGQPTCTS